MTPFQALYGFINNLQVGFDGRHKKLTGSIRSTKQGFVKKGFCGDNWIKPKKNKTNANELGNTCYYPCMTMILPLQVKSLIPPRCQALPPSTKEIYNENRFAKRWTK